MGRMNIENVVASTSLGQELDLNAIEGALEGAEYNPPQFPGLVYRLKEPKTATLLFRSGKVVCTGAKSLDDVKVAIGKVKEDLKKVLSMTFRAVVPGSDSPDATNKRPMGAGKVPIPRTHYHNTMQPRPEAEP